MNKAAQQAEAAIRLNMLKQLYKVDVNNEIVINTDRGIVTASPVFAVSSAKTKTKIAELEKEKKISVYYVIESHNYINYLFVGTYESDWDKERPDYLFASGFIFAYVENKEIEDFSEFGTIPIKAVKNAIIRIDVF